MKKLLSIGFICAAVAFSASAEEAATLTRAQWLKQIGPSASNYNTLKATIAQVPAEDKVYFAHRLIKAVSRMAVNQAEKSAAFVRAAVGLIAGGKGEEKYSLIAEVFAETPIEYLPAVTEALAKRFDQKINNLSDEAYEAIASKAIAAGVTRNAQTSDPAVRDAFIALCFTKASSEASEIATGEAMIAKLPEGRIQSLAGQWVPKALDGDYSDMLAAADVKALAIPKALSGRSDAIGSQTVLNILADLNTAQNVNDAGGKMTLGEALSLSDDHDAFTQGGAIFNPNASEAGLSRRPNKAEVDVDDEGGGGHRPEPYQNQRTGI